MVCFVKNKETGDKGGREEGGMEDGEMEDGKDEEGITGAANVKKGKQRRREAGKRVQQLEHISVGFPPTITYKAHQRKWGSSEINDPGIKGFGRLFAHLLGCFCTDRALCIGSIGKHYNKQEHHCPSHQSHNTNFDKFREAFPMVDYLLNTGALNTAFIFIKLVFSFIRVELTW